MNLCRKIRKGVSLLTGFAMITCCGIAAAQVVTVEGFGDDRGGAINDAKRNAVEEVVGAYLQSKTIVNNGGLKLDSIYSKTAGFVRDIKILSEGYRDGGYYVQATIDISDRFINDAEKELMVVASMNNPRIGIQLSGTINGQQIPRHHLKTFEVEIIQYLIKKGMTHVFVLEAPSSIGDSYNMIDDALDVNEEYTPSDTFDEPNVILSDNDVIISEEEDVSANTDDVNNVYEQQDMMISSSDDELGIGETSYKVENHIDYILQGTLTARSNSVKLPSYKEMTKEGVSMYDTGLTRSVVTFQAGLYHAVTKEVMGEFQLSTNAIDNTTEDALVKAISTMSMQVGDKVWKVFNQRAAILPHGITLNVNTKDYDKVIRLAELLRDQAAIQNVTIRAYSDSMGTLSVDTELTSAQLFKLMRSFDGMFISMGNQSEGLLEVNI